LEDRQAIEAELHQKLDLLAERLRQEEVCRLSGRSSSRFDVP
jgi:hypothetical protein